MSRILYRILLLAYPRAFRAAHGDDAADVFVDLHRAEYAKGIGSLIALWWRTCGAVLRGGLQERRRPAARATRSGVVAGLFGGDPARDARFALRSLRKNPGFTVVVVLTLALGIGANTAIFSVVNAVLFAPLPFPEPDRLYRIAWQWNRGDQGVGMSAYKVEFWRRNTQAFASIGAFGGGGGFNLAADPLPLRLTGMRVSYDFFETFGIEPARGRVFTAAEDQPGGPSVGLISHELWTNEFGADPDILGTNLIIDGAPRTVIGILAEDFRMGRPVDLIVPIQLTPDPTDGAHNYTMVGRLAPGSSAETAAAEARTMFDRYFAEFPEGVEPESNAFVTQSFAWFTVGAVRQSLLLLFGAVGVVLLIACANVANLMLSRAAARQQEISIRTALGASRGRLFRQLLVESLLLVTAASLLGLLFARWTLTSLVALIPVSVPRIDQVRIDPAVLVFTLAVAGATGIAFGLLSTVRFSVADLSGALKASGRGSTDGGGGALRSALVVTEVALAALLLVGAALLLGSLFALQGVGLGFDPAGTMAMEVLISGERHADPAASWAFEREVLERIRARPGVIAAGSVTSVPLERGLNMPADALVDGEYLRRTIEYRAVSPGYFEALGVSMAQGRDFRAGAAELAPVAVVNEAYARRFWPDRSAVGQRLIVGRDFGDYEGPQREVIGVVADVLELGVANPSPPTVFVPRYQAQPALNAMINNLFPTAFVIRASSFEGLAERLREEVAAVDAFLPVTRFRTMDEVAADSIQAPQFNTLLMASFAGLALLLTSIGVYGVISYSVGRQTREIGVRVALGAQRSRVIADVVGRGTRLVAVGLTLGLAGAWWMSRFLEGMLFAVSRTDPVVFAGVAAVLLGVAGLACLIPAHRASRVDPVIALRSD